MFRVTQTSRVASEKPTPKPPLAAQSTKARSGPFAIIIQWGKDIVYINATSTRECTFALSFAR
ncbi:hypothetical protein [Octadecabacter arcticus]|uniref:hypothetical protein n=1 Tax=Octadecabacter arcticus TaxID=53946 RepID=UPI00031E3893|nr:hypothetical protein [Octadecabacter arcticus]